jgi:hypothetical protein
VVRPDGWIVLNDYVPLEIGGSNMPYGVIQAAHEFMVEADYERSTLPWDGRCSAMSPSGALASAGACVPWRRKTRRCGAAWRP